MRQQAKLQRKKKLATVHCNEKIKTNLIIQMEEMNQKILEKEERLKRYQDRIKQYKQNLDLSK